MDDLIQETWEEIKNEYSQYKEGVFRGIHFVVSAREKLTYILRTHKDTLKDEIRILDNQKNKINKEKELAHENLKYVNTILKEE